MKAASLLSSFLLLTFFCTAQSGSHHKPDSLAIALNNKATALFRFADRPDSAEKALAFLERATAIDTGYFNAFNNQLILQIRMGRFSQAVTTVNKLIRLRPRAHDLYMMSGILYEKTGDTVAAKARFEKSLSLSAAVLDTMRRANRDYGMFARNHAITLVMLGRRAQAHETLNQLLAMEKDRASREATMAIMLKSKKELIDALTSGG